MQINRILLLLLVVFPILSFIKSENKLIHLYESSTIKCSYSTTDGRFDGNYISYYKNGIKKSEGKFEHNYRAGKWTVWDSTGRIRMQREYETPFSFKRIVPEVPKEKPIELLNIPKYNIQYNNDGYIEYFKLKERMIYWSRRVWRLISPKENPILFENNKFFSFLIININAKNITPFSAADDEFKTELPPSIDTSSIKIIGYRLKEDTFFDNERLVSETRIIGICPVAINKIKKDTVNLFWVYLPEMRKYLAKEKVAQPSLPSKVKTLDDLFFYRYFSGEIYKATNLYDKPISAYKSGKEIEREAERIELDLIEKENDIWIGFTK